MRTELTPKDRAILLSALVFYQLDLRDRIEFWEKNKDAELVKSYKEKLEEAKELYQSNRLI